jgi:integrase
VERAREAGVELPSRVTPHSLRHTYASLMIAAGVNAKAVQVHLGHANIRETFDTYSHLFDDQHEVSRDAIGAALRRDEAPGLRSVQS